MMRVEVTVVLCLFMLFAGTQSILVTWKSQDLEKCATFGAWDPSLCGRNCSCTSGLCIAGMSCLGVVPMIATDGDSVICFCVNLQNDTSNCGQLGRICPSNSTCKTGECGMYQ